MKVWFEIGLISRLYVVPEIYLFLPGKIWRIFLTLYERTYIYFYLMIYFDKSV